MLSVLGRRLGSGPGEGEIVRAGQQRTANGGLGAGRKTTV